MIFAPRWYQTEAVDAALTFFKSKKKDQNGLEILPTGSGKSVVIANIAKGLPSVNQNKTVIFQPSKEILEQNFRKFLSQGGRAGIYSASAGMKFVDNICFATIGSVAKKHHLFREHKNIIIDEAHLVNSEAGMYFNFINAIEGAKVLGLTATPYRLSTGMEGAMLKFLTRTRPKIFNKCIYYVQNDVLFNEGHLSKLEYFKFNVVDRKALEANTTGTDFTDASLKNYYRQINMPKQTASYAHRILAKRKNCLIFCSLVAEAEETAKYIPGAVVIHGQTPAPLRAKILSDFVNHRIRCVVNVGVLTTGFDFPELEATIISRSTMSLSIYYQIIGRVMRPHPNKESGWVIDLGGNFDLFGKIETMRIIADEKGKLSIMNNGRHLTGVAFRKN